MAFTVGAPVRLVVRAAKHVNPKATKHHTKTRPKKVRPRSTVAHAQPILSKWALNPETRGAERGKRAGSPVTSGSRAFRPSIARPRRGDVIRVASRRFRPRPGPTVPEKTPRIKSLTFSAPFHHAQNSQHTPSDRNRKKVEYPALKPEEIPPLMTVISK